MKILGVMGAAAICAGFATGADAGHWLYQFDATSAYSGDNYGSFTYSSPTAVTGYTFLNNSDMDSCTVTAPALPSCAFVQLIPDYISYDSVWFNGTGGSSNVYYFTEGAFSTAGTYSTVLFGSNQAATLHVSFVEDRGVPEPAAWAMMVTGFGLAGAAMRRQARTQLHFG